MNISKNKIRVILPRKPRKISEDLPGDVEILSAEATLSKDARDQYFVRFPRKIAEALYLENVRKIEFIITTKLPEANPENAELIVKLIRK